MTAYYHVSNRNELVQLVVEQLLNRIKIQGPRLARGICDSEHWRRVLVRSRRRSGIGNGRERQRIARIQTPDRLDARGRTMPASTKPAARPTALTYTHDRSARSRRGRRAERDHGRQALAELIDQSAGDGDVARRALRFRIRRAARRARQVLGTTGHVRP